jgi:hypothetical protein
LAIAFRASTEAHVTTGSLTITIPSAVQAGDVLLLIGGMNDAGVSANDWATPSGWTALDTRRVPSNLFAAAYTRVAQSGDPGSTVTLSTSGTGKACAIIAAYSGIDPSGPINISAVASETTLTASHTTPTVTTTAADTRVIIAAVQSDSATQSWNTPSGYTKRQDSLDNTNLGGHVTATVQDKAASTVGSYGGEALVAGAASSKAVMYTIAIAPASTTQTARPVSDVSNTGVVGVPAPGGGSGVYARVGALVDTEYAEYSDSGDLVVGVSALADPNTGSGHVVKFRARYAAGASGGSVTTKLLQGATEIASWTDTVSGTFADFTHTLNSTQANAISDYSALRFEQTVTLS